MTTDAPATKMPGGYCFLFSDHAGKRVGRNKWHESISDDWETEVYSPTGGEKVVGRKRIDDATCVVFECPDGEFRAVTRTAAGV